MESLIRNLRYEILLGRALLILICEGWLGSCVGRIRGEQVDQSRREEQIEEEFFHVVVS